MLRIGTRGSQLALWQANTVAARIAEAGGPPCSIVTIRTSGDRQLEAPLSEIGGKQLFVKEIEDALLSGEIDVAVHSSKDMAAILPDGLEIAAVLPRENPLDAIVLPLKGTESAGAALASLEELIAVLGQSPSIGTGSVRRVAQLRRLIPSARFPAVRGNVDTRLRKLDAGGFDVLALAAAGLVRLGFGSRISLSIPAAACIPAPGQGIVAIEIRADREEIRRAVAAIDDSAAAAALEAERALVAALGGECRTPIGALASPVDGDVLELIAVVASPDGSRAVHGRGRASAGSAAALGRQVADQLVQEGANEILGR